jgi:hypothetical protein
MQPTYQVPWEHLSAAHRDLLAYIRMNEVHVRPILFLCGVKFAATYSSAYFAKNPKAEHLGPCHPLDDGLEQTCCAVLKALMKLTRSRESQSLLRQLHGVASEGHWVRLKLAFIRISEKGLPPRAASWLRKGDLGENWIRVSFGMGAIAPYQTDEFIGSLLKTRFSFGDCDGCDVTTQIVAVVARFAWSPQWVLPEI